MNVKNNIVSAELQELRSRIDAIDDEIIKLLLARSQVVRRVGEYKRKSAVASCPIRSGREAEMLRRIFTKFSNTNFPPEAAVAIWRIIIGASTGMESDMTLSVLADKSDADVYWLAREYFGAHSSIIKQPHVNRVVGDVADAKAAVGIVPFSYSSQENGWWRILLQQGESAIKIFARIPFVMENDGREKMAFAFASLMPEPSGDDKSLLVIEAESNVSQSRLQTALQKEKLEATWLDIAASTAESRFHFLEISGFIDEKHEGFSRAIHALGAAVVGVNFLGAYAVPIYTNEKEKSMERQSI